MRRKCIVKGCENYTHQGNFVGDICAPCYKYLVDGEIGPTTSFLKELRDLKVNAEMNPISSIERVQVNNPEKGDKISIRYIGVSPEMNVVALDRKIYEVEIPKLNIPENELPLSFTLTFEKVNKNKKNT